MRKIQKKKKKYEMKQMKLTRHDDKLYNTKDGMNYIANYKAVQKDDTPAKVTIVTYSS